MSGVLQREAELTCGGGGGGRPLPALEERRNPEGPQAGVGRAKGPGGSRLRRGAWRGVCQRGSLAPQAPPSARARAQERAWSPGEVSRRASKRSGRSPASPETEPSSSSTAPGAPQARRPFLLRSPRRGSGTASPGDPAVGLRRGEAPKGGILSRLPFQRGLAGGGGVDLDSENLPLGSLSCGGCASPGRGP